MKNRELLSWLGMLLMVLGGTVEVVGATGPTVDWVTQTTGSTRTKARGIAVDPAGNCYVTGEFSGKATFGSETLTAEGDMDCFVAKCDAAGNFVWARRAGKGGTDRGYGVAVNSSGVYITGHFQGTNGITDAEGFKKSRVFDIFVAKYDLAGKLIWLREAGKDGYDYGHSVALDSAGNVFVAGGFAGTVDFGTATLTTRSSEAFLAKYHSDGTLQWAKKADTGGSTAANGVALDSSGNVFLAGSFAGKGKFAEDELVSYGLNDAFVAKFSHDGKPLWARLAGGSTNDFAHGVTTDAAGSAYFVGAFQGDATFGTNVLHGVGKHDLCVFKYDAAGKLQWVRHGGGEGTDYALGVTVDKQGNCYATGEYFSKAMFEDVSVEGKGGIDMFVTKYDHTGKPVWVFSIGGPKNDYSYCIGTDAKGNCYAAGGFSGSLELGGKTLTSTRDELFIVKLRP